MLAFLFFKTPGIAGIRAGYKVYIYFFLFLHELYIVHVRMLWVLKRSQVLLLMSTNNMFPWRNRKNINIYVLETISR